MVLGHVLYDFNASNLKLCFSLLASQHTHTILLSSSEMSQLQGGIQLEVSPF